MNAIKRLNEAVESIRSMMEKSNVASQLNGSFHGDGWKKVNVIATHRGYVVYGLSPKGGHRKLFLDHGAAAARIKRKSKA